MGQGDSGLGLARGQVRLAEPTARWAVLFEEEAHHLEAALRPFGAAVEHCGSTAVPGIPAKPILDILAGIAEPLGLGSIRSALASLGYEHATWAGVSGHEVFGRGDPRTHLVHLVPLRGPAWDRMLRFRDALRADSSLAAGYGELKRRLAALHPNDRPAYTEAKADFVGRVLARG